MKTEKQMTLRQHLLHEQRAFSVAQDLIFLLEDIATSCRIISNHIRGGAFTGQLGSASTENVQGETQKKLDIIANDEFVRHCSNCGRVAALVSEEVDEVYWLKDTPEDGDYIVYFDPLDGSSNIDVNLSVGSIFSIIELNAISGGTRADYILRAGTRQVAAGYAIYGPSTTLVVSTGNGVHGFTHQQGTGEFRLTHPAMAIPVETAEFAINASRYTLWEPAVRRYYDECIAGKDGPRGKSFNMRWTASMVADVHRILTRGGVFMYPVDSGNSNDGGKLRLMYEANPMAFLVEAAGGAASTGEERILEITPTDHHQRVSVMLGSLKEIERLVGYHKQK